MPDREGGPVVNGGPEPSGAPMPTGGPVLPAASPAPTPVAPPPQPPRRRHGTTLALLVGVLVVAIIWVGVGIRLATQPNPSPSSSAVADATPGPSPSPSTRLSPGPSPSPSTVASEPVHRIGERVDVGGRQAITVLAAEEWTSSSRPPAGQRYVAADVLTEALVDRSPYNSIFYRALDGTAGQHVAQLVGKPPALAYGTLARGGQARAWVTFLVDADASVVLSYRLPLGANGETAAVLIALDPIGPPTPDPMPSPSATDRPQPSTGPGGNHGYATTIASTYYSGYGAALPGGSVTEVDGSWTQPSIRCSGRAIEDASFWVGIEDVAGGQLQQLGTIGACAAGSTTPRYSVWYEMFPIPSVTVAMTVHPGDRFSASVRVSGTSWTLSLRNLTTRRSFSTTQTRRASADVALWITEPPSTQVTELGLHVLPYAQFRSVAFSGCTAIADGQRRTIGDPGWAHFRFDMFAPEGEPKATTSDLDSSGSGFTSTWRHR